MPTEGGEGSRAKERGDFERPRPDQAQGLQSGRTLPPSMTQPLWHTPCGSSAGRWKLSTDCQPVHCFTPLETLQPKCVALSGTAPKAEAS